MVSFSQVEPPSVETRDAISCESASPHEPRRAGRLNETDVCHTLADMDFLRDAIYPAIPWAGGSWSSWPGTH